MKLRIWSAGAVFVGSYLPLTLILLIQDYDTKQLTNAVCLDIWRSGCVLPFRNPAVSISAACVSFLCFLMTVIALRQIPAKQTIEIDDAKYVPADLMNYTLPYIVSLMGVSFDEPLKAIGLLVFLGWMFLITFRSGQIIMNPVLTAVGWRLYDITYHFVTDKTLRQGTALSCLELTEKLVVQEEWFQSVLIVKNGATRKGKK